MSAKRLLVVYHSQSGRNERLAYAAAEAAQQEGTDVMLRRAAEAGVQDLLNSDGLLLFTPENFGALPGGMKDFLDRCFYPANARDTVRPYAVFLCTGNDGSGAIRELERIARGLVLKPVSEPVCCTGAPDEQAIADACELASAMAAGLAMGIY